MNFVLMMMPRACDSTLSRLR